jgi:hypothetical protein
VKSAWSNTRRLALLAFAGTLLLLCSAKAAHGAQTNEGLSLLSSANAVKVSASEGKDTAETHIALFNQNPKHTRIEVRFEASSDESVRVKSVEPQRLPASEVTRVAIVFEGLAKLREAVSGELVISGGPDPIAQSVEVTPAPQPSVDWSPWIIGVSLLLAAGVAVLVVWRALPKGKRKARLGDASPGAKWEAKSWATTLTAAGGLLGTVLGGVTFPTYPEQISKEVLTNLNLFFAALVAVGPFLFQVTRRKKLSKEELKAERIGTKLTLLATATVTLWAVFGQLAAFSLLSWELLINERFWAGVVIVALCGLAVGAGRYFFRTMREAAKRNWTKEEAEVKAKRKRRRRRHQAEQAVAFLRAPRVVSGEVTVVAPDGEFREIASELADGEFEGPDADSEALEDTEPQTIALL